MFGGALYKGDIEKIRRIAVSFDLRTAFYSHLTLENVLFNDKPYLEKFDRNKYYTVCRVSIAWNILVKRVGLCGSVWMNTRKMETGNTCCSKLAECEKSNVAFYRMVAKFGTLKLKWLECKFKKSVLISSNILVLIR